MKSRSLFTVLCLGLAPGLLSACGILKKKTDEAAPSATAAAVSAAPVAPAPTPPPPAEAAPVAAVAPPIDDAAVPAPQDFEDEAFEKVTAANFKAQLAQLTKDVAAK